MAKPMPRQRALRLLGGALVSVAVPGIATKKARAMATCHPGEIVCKCACKGDKCGACTGPICLVNCCRSDLGEYCDCARAGGCWVKPCGNPCPSGYKCCEDDEFCANSQQHLCCKRGQRGCELECCDSNEECRKIRVGTGSKDICTKRCPPGRAWCGRDNCCPPKWKCINESKRLCKRCWPEEEECGKKCCDKKTSRCCGKAGCCPKGARAATSVRSRSAVRPGRSARSRSSAVISASSRAPR